MGLPSDGCWVPLTRQSMSAGDGTGVTFDTSSVPTGINRCYFRIRNTGAVNIAVCADGNDEDNGADIYKPGDSDLTFEGFCFNKNHAIEAVGDGGAWTAIATVYYDVGVKG